MGYADQVSASSPLLGLFLLVCVVIFTSSQGRNHFGVVLFPIWATCTISGLWNHFGLTLVKGVLEGHVLRRKKVGVGYKVIAGFEQVCHEKRTAAEAWLDGE